MILSTISGKGFDGPFQGGKHLYMIKGELVLTIPNPHPEDISVDLIVRIIRQAGISREDWLKKLKPAGIHWVRPTRSWNGQGDGLSFPDGNTVFFSDISRNTKRFWSGHIRNERRRLGDCPIRILVPDSDYEPYCSLRYDESSGKVP